MNKYIKSAILEAQKGIHAGHGGPFGAVIVKDGKIISRGHNEVLLNNDSTCHAEMQTIRKACKKLKTYDLSGCDIYITSKPCPMCFCALLWANINKIYYGCNASDAERIGFRDEKFEEVLAGGVDEHLVEIDREECLKLYDEYESIKDRIIY